MGPSAHLCSYGGIYETTKPAREYTLDDFVTLNLEKLDKYTHIRGTGLEELEWRGSSDEEGDSSDEDDSRRDGSSDEEDEEEVDEGVEGDEIEVDDEDEEAKAKRHAALTQAEKVSLGPERKWVAVSRHAGLCATRLWSTD